jgi:hypothetical protein
MPWKNSPPGPKPPGPTSNPSNTDPKWDAWAKSVLNTAWSAYLWSSLATMKNPVSEITGSKTGRRIPIPISGDDPSAWAADAGKWEGTLDVDSPFGKAGTLVDYTRYKRTYPKVVFQDYQEIIVTLKYGWGDCSAWSHFWRGKMHCLHAEREIVFWYPVGKPYSKTNVVAYRWQHTSSKKSGGVSIPEVGGVSGSGSTFIPWDPENPPKEPQPDDFHPDHKKPPEGKRNGPFVTYGLLANITNTVDIVADRLAYIIDRKGESESLTSTDLAEAITQGYQALKYIEAENVVNLNHSPEDVVRSKAKRKRS